MLNALVTFLGTGSHSYLTAFGSLPTFPPTQEPMRVDLWEGLHTRAGNTQHLPNSVLQLHFQLNCNVLEHSLC